MSGVAVVNAVIFGVYGQSQKFLSEASFLSSEHLSGHFLAGASAGMAQAPICSPIELAKTRLQLQNSHSGQRSFTGPLECLRHIHRTEGLRGVFNGLGITVAREIPGFGVYFATYEALTRSNEQISTAHMLLAGGLAGTASWVVSYPLDVVKSRMQADSERKYSGAMDCFRKSVASEGYGCMFRGLNSTIIRAFPCNAVTFTVVTWTMRLFSDEKPKTVARIDESSQAFKPKSWDNALDRYGETSRRSLHTLGDATGNLLQQFAGSRLSLLPSANAADNTAKLPTAHKSSEQFDETDYFECASEVVHP